MRGHVPSCPVPLDTWSAWINNSRVAYGPLHTTWGARQKVIQRYETKELWNYENKKQASEKIFRAQTGSHKPAETQSALLNCQESRRNKTSSKTTATTLLRLKKACNYVLCFCLETLLWLHWKIWAGCVPNGTNTLTHIKRLSGMRLPGCVHTDTWIRVCVWDLSDKPKQATVFLMRSQTKWGYIRITAALWIIEAYDTPRLRGSNDMCWHRPLLFLLTYIVQMHTLSVSHTNKRIPEDTH